jgi:hypothetical protein
LIRERSVRVPRNQTPNQDFFESIVSSIARFVSAKISFEIAHLSNRRKKSTCARMATKIFFDFAVIFHKHF